MLARSLLSGRTGVDGSRQKMGQLVMARRSKEWLKEGQVLSLLKEDDLETGERNLSNSGNLEGHNS